MYCETLSTWATVQDLYSRYGDEYIDKLAIRRVWDVDLEQYVADESQEGKLHVIELALCDAKTLLKQKLSCLYSKIDLLDHHIFSSIKLWHIKLTIETLKIGGDCFKCTECLTSFDEYSKCGAICSDDGVCLPSNKSAISVSEAKFKCEECLGECKC